MNQSIKKKFNILRKHLKDQGDRKGELWLDALWRSVWEETEVLYLRETHLDTFFQAEGHTLRALLQQGLSEESVYNYVCFVLSLDNKAPREDACKNRIAALAEELQRQAKPETSDTDTGSILE